MKAAAGSHFIDQVRRHLLLTHRLVRLHHHTEPVGSRLLHHDHRVRRLGKGGKGLHVHARLRRQAEPAAQPRPEGRLREDGRRVEEVLALHALVQRGAVLGALHLELHQAGAARLGREGLAAVGVDLRDQHARAERQPETAHGLERHVVDGVALVGEKGLALGQRGCEEEGREGEECLPVKPRQGRYREEGGGVLNQRVHQRGVRCERVGGAKPLHARKTQSAELLQEESVVGLGLLTPVELCRERGGGRERGRRRTDLGPGRRPPRTTPAGRDGESRGCGMQGRWLHRALHASGAAQPTLQCCEAVMQWRVEGSGNESRMRLIRST